MPNTKYQMSNGSCQISTVKRQLRSAAHPLQRYTTSAAPRDSPVIPVLATSRIS